MESMVMVGMEEVAGTVGVVAPQQPRSRDRAPRADASFDDATLVDAARAERRRRFEAEALVHLDALFSFGLKLARSRD